MIFYVSRAKMGPTIAIVEAKLIPSWTKLVEVGQSWHQNRHLKGLRSTLKWPLGGFVGSSGMPLASSNENPKGFLGFKEGPGTKSRVRGGTKEALARHRGPWVQS